LLCKKKSRAHSHGPATHHQRFNLFAHILCERIAQLAGATPAAGTILQMRWM
jgi:hypothetical protein